MPDPIVTIHPQMVDPPQAHIITPLDINFIGYVSDDNLVLCVRSKEFGLTGLEARFAMMDPIRGTDMRARMLEIGRRLFRAEPAGRA